VVLFFAGCDAPSHWCEVHHLLHWADDGETVPENLALLCERHHTKVHHGFTVHRDPHGRWHTHRPDGTEIRTVAPLAPMPGGPGDARDLERLPDQGGFALAGAAP
jgi:hypothetical protein